MDRQRVRIRFRKQDDLRLISHRDLARAWERLFRRAGLPLAMSEGYHPHAKINFPSALALGVEGWDEVVEVTLDRDQPNDSLHAEELRERLVSLAPPGLVITRVVVLAQGHPKPQVESVSYRLPVPADRHDALQQAIDRLLAKSTHQIDRPVTMKARQAGRRRNRRSDDPRRTTRLDLRGALERLSLADGHLWLTLRMDGTGQIRPAEVLTALDAEDLLQGAINWTRTGVHLAEEDALRASATKGTTLCPQP